MEAKHDGFDLTSKNDSYKHKNQFVGIKFENRVSRVTVVDQEEAKQFVR